MPSIRDSLLPRTRGVYLLLAVALVGATPSWADEKAVRAALDKPIKCEFQQVPLEDVVASLASQAGVAIRLDRRALDSANIKPSTRISFTSPGFTLRSVLRNLPRAESQMGIVPLIREWGIELTTDVEGEKAVVVRLLDVTPLVPTDAEDVDELTLELDSALKLPGRRKPGWEEDGGFGRISTDHSGFWMVRTTDDVNEHVTRVFDALLKARDKNDQAEAQRGDPSDRYQSIGTTLPPTALHEAIQRALTQRGDFEFDKTPLHSVVEELSKRYEIPMQIDRVGVDSGGIGIQTPVTWTGKDIRFSDFLNLMLREHDLVYVVQNEVMLITTVDEQERMGVVRVYPVGDLLPTTDRDLRRQLMSELSTLIEQNASHLTPGWDSAGGTGRIELVPMARALVIYTTMPAHGEVEALLAKLRQARKSRLVLLPAEPDFVTKRYLFPRRSANNGSEPAPTTAKSPPKIPPSFDQLIRQFVAQAVGAKEPGPETDRGDVITLEDAVVVRNSPAVHRKLRKRLGELQLLDEGIHFLGGIPTFFGSGNSHLPYSPSTQPR